MAKILIADDSGTIRKIVKMTLEKAGYEVIEATNGLEAMQLVQKEMPNVVLLDAEMPEMDGWEVCKTIKSNPQTSNIVVLMATGHDLSEEQEQLSSVGANGYITKPYQATQILEKISKLLK